MKEKIKEILLAMYELGKLNSELNISHSKEWVLPDLFTQTILDYVKKEQEKDLFPPVRTLDEFIKKNINDEYQTCEYCGKEFLADYKSPRCPDCVIANMSRRHEEEYDEGADY